MCGRVKTAVQLSHRDALRVDDRGLNLELVLLGDLPLRQGGEALGQDLVGLRLPTHRVSDDHNSVSHVQHRLQLDDLLHEPVRGLQVVFLAKFLEVSVVSVGNN